jgi:hypothetical protein
LHLANSIKTDAPYASIVSMNTKAGITFTEKIVDLVLTEYPVSNEQASVLTSKVLYLIEQEITNNRDALNTETGKNAVISEVAFFYDAAVDKLTELNKPLLKKGAVQIIFMV